MIFKKSSKFFLLSTCIVFSVNAAANSVTHTNNKLESKQSIRDALVDGKAELDFRLRYESADGGAPRSGAALTLKTALSYSTASYQNFSGKLTFNDNTPVIDRKLNSASNTTPDKAKRAAINDPKGSTLTEAYVQYEGIEDAAVLFGRQYISFDNERFIGKREFRQTPQSFDALRVIYTGLSDIVASYAYIDQVNTIFSNNAKALNRVLHHHSHFLHLIYSGLPVGNLSAYTYLIDDRNIPSNSSLTVGARFAGSYEIQGLNTDYEIEFAKQSEASNNPQDYDANYAMLGFNINLYPLYGQARIECLSGNKNTAGKSFQTPLATVHDFLGHADIFPVTPAAGIIDYMLKIGSNIHGMDADITFHRFGAEDSSQRYGIEWDVTVQQQINDYAYFSLSLADFSAAHYSGFANVTKFWITVGASY